MRTNHPLIVDTSHSPLHPQYFARPSYQSTQVASFLTAQGSTYSTYYNATGRGFPDVAAQGENFAVVVGGFTESVAGTSASSPTFAAVVSLLNDYLIGQGKPTLGFLNPWLYSTGTAGEWFQGMHV